MNKIIRSIVVFLYYLLFFPKIIGKENIPKNKRVVLAGNHTSNLDWGLLMISTKRPVHFLAKKELFKSRILGYFLKKMKIIPVDRKNKNKEALMKATEYLKEERLVGIFPESTLNKEKKTIVLPFKIGAVKMAYDAKAPIVPFTIKGGFIPIFKRPVIEFYEPITVSSDLEKENNKLMDIIIEGLTMKKLPVKGYKFFKLLLGPVFRLWYRPKIYGKENIPKEGSIVVAANHVHLFDQFGPILATKRVIHYMAKKEYFDSKHAWFFKMTGCISVDRSTKDDDAKSQAMDVLKSGGAIGIFPEGTRNKTKEFMLPFKFGPVSMASKTDSYLVPVGITGEYKFRSKNLRFYIGEPFKVGKMTLEEANKKLFDEIVKLRKKGMKETKSKK